MPNTALGSGNTDVNVICIYLSTCRLSPLEYKLHRVGNLYPAHLTPSPSQPSGGGIVIIFILQMKKPKFREGIMTCLTLHNRLMEKLSFLCLLPQSHSLSGSPELCEGRVRLH